MMYNFEPLLLTFRLAAITTFILILIGIPLAYWMAFSRFRMKPLFEALLSMPLVLPPSVLGFYLLVAFGPSHFPGNFLKEYLDLQLVFSFEGLIVASVIYSLPFMVHPLQSGFQSLPTALREVSYTLGKSRAATLFQVILPGAKASVLTGIVLSFAHTIGEFGVVLMIGGNIPGETRVASIAIYDEVEALNYDTANFYSLILFAITFAILLIVYSLNKKLIRTI